MSTDLSIPESGGLAQWQHAEEFNQQIRWGRFKPEGMPDAELVAILGRDANNYLHGFRQRQLGTIMAKRLGWSEEDIAVIALTEELHDIGECESAGSIAGDVSYSLKTAQDEAEEASLLERHLRSDPAFAHLGDALLERILAILHDADKKPPQTREGLFFNTSERLGYMLTAFNSFDVMSGKKIVPELDIEDLDPEDRHRFDWLEMNIFANNITPLITRHLGPEPSIVPELDEYVARMLSLFGPQIATMFAHHSDNIQTFHALEFRDIHNRKDKERGKRPVRDVVMESAVAADATLIKFLQAKIDFQKIWYKL